MIPRTRHQRGSLSRDKILRVASEQFDLKGYDRTSLDDVANALSVTKPSLYYHFDNKEDILLGCVTEACERLDAALAAADSPKLPGRTRLEIFLHEYLTVIVDNFGVSLVLGDDRVMSPEGRLEYFARRRKINQHVTDVVAQGMRDGSIAPGDVTLTVYAIFGMFNWVTRWRSRKPKPSTEEVYRAFCGLLFGGIGNDAAAPSRTKTKKKKRKHE
jgi:AcrR family transcriptional regulator